MPIDQIDLSDSPVHSDADFHKVSRNEVIEGLTKLRQVQQWIEEGATDQMLRDFDERQGLSGAQGYHSIYRVSYGDSAIALEQVGDELRRDQRLPPAGGGARTGVDGDPGAGGAMISAYRQAQKRHSAP